jgi:hypothetical protein
MQKHTITLCAVGFRSSYCLFCSTICMDKFLEVKDGYPNAQPTSWKTTTVRLSVSVDSINSQILEKPKTHHLVLV